MFQIIKDNIIYMILVLISIALSVHLIAPKITSTYDIIVEANGVKQQLNDAQTRISDLKMQESAKSKIPAGETKQIFELEGAQFSPEASFAPLFEVVLNVAQTSGLRIRSIDYNYKPEGDQIYAARMAEYNVCELSIVAVGSYTQLQNFFKGLVKDQYLNSIAEVELMPWDKDKSILISNMKIRLYTKTPGAASSIPRAPQGDAGAASPEMPMP